MTQTPLAPEVATPFPALDSDNGLINWIATTDHKKIGILYLLLTLVFLGIGGVEALLLRVQLARPENSFLSPQVYNQIFTMHGTTMIFLVVMPMLIGFGNYLIPLMIGARDMAFPRLNAMGFWMLLFGGLLIYFSFIGGPAAGAPDAGWFSYAPLSEKPYSFSTGQDYWGLGLLVTGIGTVTAGINFIVTILKLRAPGLTLTRLPLFVWMMLVNSFLIVIAISLFNAALVMLVIDRLLDAHFFKPDGGGSALLWQHYFWAFGHPEVYIMALPAFGMISEIIPVFSRKPIFGYTAIALSTVAIGFLSLLVWAHHMFVVGLGEPANVLFGASSMLIAIPTGIKVFTWMATMWGGAIRFTTAMLFATAFVVLFTMGGITGVMFAAVPIDYQVTDTYFVVAHFHYVLFGGTFFAVMGGFYYWFPKVTGRMMSEKLGKWHFWLLLIGFNMTFFIQHILGLLGMPRRVYTYPDLPSWAWMNQLSTVGAFVMGIAILFFLWNLWFSLRHDDVAGDNPWQAWTLEWATSSPPPVQNFDRLPPVRSRRPLWDVAHPEDPDWRHAEGRGSDSEPPIRVEKNELGVAIFLMGEANFFLLLLLAYLILHTSGQGGPDANNSLDPLRAGLNTLFLLASSFTIWQAKKGERRQSRRTHLWLLATILLGGFFLVGQGLEYRTLFQQDVTIGGNLFGASFYTLTGFHGLHVLAGLVALTILLVIMLMNKGQRSPSRGLHALALYWHFVDVVWIALFVIIYLGIYV